MQRLINANAVKENHKRWLGYLDDDMIGRMNFAIDHHVPTVLTIPDNPTNGDMIKALFSVVGFTPLTWRISSDRKEGFHVHIEDCFKDDFRLTVSKDWWNAPYKAEIKPHESEDT